MIDRPDDVILAHSNRALLQYGDTPQGANWPNEADRHTRFDVMLDVIAAQSKEPVVLCDLGCGTGELLSHIRERGLSHITYIGIDRSGIALAHARNKFPGITFLEIDINDPNADLGQLGCDYLVANGLFTVKWELSQEQMLSFLESSIKRVWPQVRRGLAFNVMSKIVDWERDDLFHVPMDDCARMLHALAGRRIRFRADYGLYEYTAYAFKTEVGHSGKSTVDATSVAAPEPTSASGKISVLRPLLPSSEALLPYLRRIDATRIYSNYGPLVTEFENHLTQHFQLPAGGFVSASSGTAALVGAILASAGRATQERPFALLPAFTFVATAVAVEQCGYHAYLADVDADSWMLDPERLLDHPQLNRIGVVIAVAPFGRPIPQSAWLAFREKTGIPVVIDGAASFEGVSEFPSRYLGDIPVMMSFHATKSFATGEGGCVATTDIDLAARTTQALNFGFFSARDSRSASINGKMSEYHAAVGLAELDDWDRKRTSFRQVADTYRRLLAGTKIAERFIATPDISSSYSLFRCNDGAESQRMQNALREHDVEFRLWYGAGLQQQSYFANNDRDNLGVTESIAPCLLGLPMAADLTEATIARVVAALLAGLANSR
jgi:dTDP-4-amino-4,6-dideoxygalactose transaminase